MSGRNKSNNRNFGRSGRGGRGRGPGRSNNNSKNKNKSSGHKSINELVYTANNASEFEKITKQLILHIQATYTDGGQDMAKSLDERKLIDFESLKPSLQVSINPDNDVATVENRQFEIEFQQDYERWSIRKSKFETNCSRSYAFLFEHCSKSIQSKLQARDDFESKIKNDPVELLKAIQQHSVEFQEKAYPLATIVTAQDNVLNCNQKTSESVVDYAANFKSTAEVFQAQSGKDCPIMIWKYIKLKKERRSQVIRIFFTSHKPN